MIAAVGRSLDGRVGVKIQRDVALEPDGAGQVDAGGDMNRAAARCVAGLDGSVDGRGIERGSVARGSVILDVDEAEFSGRNRIQRWYECSHNEADKSGLCISAQSNRAGSKAKFHGVKTEIEVTWDWLRTIFHLRW